MTHINYIIFILLLTLLLVILLLSINLISYEECNIINPCDYTIIKKIRSFNKFLSTKNLLEKIKADNYIINLFTKIKDIVKKEIVYAIKKNIENNKYRLELYLYKSDLEINKSSNKSKHDTFLNNIIDVIKILNLTIDENEIKNKI